MEASAGHAPGTFCKYEKMAENSGAVGAAAGTARYIVTEKIHGANFCIIATFSEGTSVEVQFAKRTAVLGGAADAEDFYSCRSTGLLRELAPSAEAVLRQIAGEGGICPGAAAVHIYGELFGGSYPHPEVDAVQGLEPVQVGVWYAPNLRFMAFDVAVDIATQRSYLDFGDAQGICTRCGILFVQSLRVGTLAECLDFEIEFNTTIPERLGYPPLLSGASESPDNLAEGVVIRPQHEPHQPPRAGAGRKESARGLFKRKIASFSEKRYQNDDWKKGKAGGGGVAPVITDEESSRYEIMANVTEARLAAVLSKIGRVDPADKEACLKLLEDFKEDVREALEALEEQDAHALRSSPDLQQDLDQWSRQLITRELVGKRKKQKASQSEGNATHS